MSEILKELEIIKKMASSNDLLNIDDAAKFLGVSKKTIQTYSVPTAN